MRAQLQALVKRSYACERAGACTVNFARPIMVLLGSALGFERFRSPLGSRVPIARTRASAAAKIYNSLVRVRAHNPCVCIALVRVRAPVGKGAFRSYACELYFSCFISLVRVRATAAYFHFARTRARYSVCANLVTALARVRATTFHNRSRHICARTRASHQISNFLISLFCERSLFSQISVHEYGGIHLLA